MFKQKNDLMAGRLGLCGNPGQKISTRLYVVGCSSSSLKKVGFRLLKGIAYLFIFCFFDGPS